MWKLVLLGIALVVIAGLLDGGSFAASERWHNRDRDGWG